MINNSCLADIFLLLDLLTLLHITMSLAYAPSLFSVNPNFVNSLIVGYSLYYLKFDFAFFMTPMYIYRITWQNIIWVQS